MIILPVVKKHSFITVGYVKDTLQGVGVSVSKATIERTLYQHDIQRVYQKQERPEFAKPLRKKR